MNYRGNQPFLSTEIHNKYNLEASGPAFRLPVSLRSVRLLHGDAGVQRQRLGCAGPAADQNADGKGRDQSKICMRFIGEILPVGICASSSLFAELKLLRMMVPFSTDSCKPVRGQPAKKRLWRRFRGSLQFAAFMIPCVRKTDRRFRAASPHAEAWADSAEAGKNDACIT